MNAPASLHSADSSEWYTPVDLIEATHACMGGIDLDPASSPIAQEHVRATSWFAVEGLERPWSGRVFLNPPSPPREWWCKLSRAFERGEVKQAVYVVYSIEQLQQCQGWPAPSMFRHSICFPRKRLRFRKEMNGFLWEGDAPSHASAIVGLGSPFFRSCFEGFGEIVG